MFKLRNHRKIVYMFRFVTFCLSVFFFLWISVWGSWEWTPLDFVSQWVDKMERQFEVNSSKWKAVVKDLYSDALEQIQYSQVSPVFQAVKQTTQSLNDQYLCTIKDEDVINILYKVNSVLKNNIKNLWQNISTPTKNDMISSCSKLNNCIFNSDKATTTPDSLSYCKLVANNTFVEEYANSYNISSIWDDNKGHDAFWNSSLSDSSYDILNDINVLSKILFDSVDEPVEVLFYEMPTVSVWDDWDLDWGPTMQNDWYSPYYIPVNDPDGGEWDGGWWGDWWDWWDPDGGEPTWWPNPVEGEEGDDFQEFVQEVTYYVEWKEWSSFLWNNCVDWFEIEWYDGYTYTVIETWITDWAPSTPTEYREQLLDDINDLWCNHNGICDLWESPSCNECAISWWWSHETHEGQLIFGEIPEIPDDPETLNCFASCSSQPCTATSCERLMCYAKCLCITYESPFFDPAEFPWLWTVFKMKFCVQPVMDHKTSTTKKVYNIATIFIEINNLIQDLRNSGELMVNKKTKEFLEAWFTNNNFAKSFSVSIDNTKKAPQSRWSEKQEKENQINLNTILMENILWFDAEETVDWSGRNKYIIKWVPTQEWDLPIGDDARPTYEPANTDVLVSSLQTEHLWEVDSEISTFLESNLDFWIAVKKIFEDMNDVAESLSKKK